MSISDVVWANELKWRTDSQVAEQTMKIWNTMDASIRNGCFSEHQVLPGALNVKRRAPALFKKLVTESGYCPADLSNSHKVNLAEREENETKVIGIQPSTSKNEISEAANGLMVTKTAAHVKESSRKLFALDWLSLFAIAVNEENAAGGRVVTAPTNGAAGIIPAVLKYFLEFVADFDKGNSKGELIQEFLLEKNVVNFLHTAAAIGMLYKRGASISAAEVGCQGEVGVASSMAAGALVAVMGGTPQQVENAAEIAMEHSLGCMLKAKESDLRSNCWLGADSLH